MPNHYHNLGWLLITLSNYDSFIIAKAGKPLVKVIRLDAPSAGQIRRLGFMTGQITVPDDFDSMGAKEIELLFGDEE